MLNKTSRAEQDFHYANSAAAMPEYSFDFVYFKKALLREWSLIVGIAAAILIVGFLYVLIAPPIYTASAALMIDTRKNQLLETQQVVVDPLIDTSGVESQVEVLKSESIALAVIRKLKLADDPEFLKPTGLAAVLPSLPSFGSDTTSTEFDKERAAVNAFAKGLAVKRLGLTYVINVDFSTRDPVKAANIANAIFEAYVSNEINARFEVTKRASDWLKGRIEGLRIEANDAEHTVQKFRADNGIVDTGRGLLSEQQIADASSQLANARADTAQAKAKLDQVSSLGNVDVPEQSLADALKDDVITRLRSQYLDLSARASDFTTRYGADHQATLRLREQMKQITISIKDEIGRIAETYKNQYLIAAARERSVQQNLSSVVAAAGTQGEVAVKLRDMESAAQSSRNLYDSFLQKSLESTQQQTFPNSDARLVTIATPPSFKSAPKTALILAGSSFLGLLLGCAAALGKERMDSSFRNLSQVEAVTGFRALGVLPKIKKERFDVVPLRKGGAIAIREIAPSTQALRYVLTSPFSRFAETFRSVKVAVDLSGISRKTKILGVVSALGHEGKSTVAANLAFLIAKTNHNVLLVDCDLRNSSLTESMAAGANAGLIEILDQSKPFNEVVFTDPVANLNFVPAFSKHRISNTSEILSSPHMANFLKVASEHYNYIILDLPPIASVVDVRAMGHLIDGFLYVVEWGRTSRDTVLGALQATEVVRDKMIGIVLNKASEGALQRSERAEGIYHFGYYLDDNEGGQSAKRSS